MRVKLDTKWDKPWLFAPPVAGSIHVLVDTVIPMVLIALLAFCVLHIALLLYKAGVFNPPAHEHRTTISAFAA
jgi:hypothetical protein